MQNKPNPNMNKPAVRHVPEEILTHEIKVLNKNIKTLVSFRYRFLMGIVSGFGTVIGATVVVSIVLFVLAQLANIGFLKPIIEWLLNLINSSK